MTAPRPKGTKRADRRALVDAGKRYHAAKLAHGYDFSDEAVENWATDAQEYREAKAAFLHASERYVVGHRKASVAFAQKHYKKSKKANQPTRTT